MKKITILFLLLMVVLGIKAQMANPVHFTSDLKIGKGAEAEIIFHATIDRGWHVYSTDIGDNGPTEATFNVVKMDGAELVGKLEPRGNVIKKMDNMFNMEVMYFEGEATFVQKIRFTKPKYDIDCYLEYGTCNDESCLPPTEVELRKSGDSPSVVATPTKVKDKAEITTSVVEPVSESVDTMAVPTEETPLVAAVDSSDVADYLWDPVTEELRALGSGEDLASHSLLWLLLMGFVGGLLAVCMPCIWPIIPMTVSFFLKRSKDDKRKGIRDAFTYGLSIIVIYLGLGLIVTAIFGSDTLNAMSTNAVFNVFLFLLLVVFALSFFGWFEIKLPDSWANAVDAKASKTSGLISIFLMAFTLVLVSFSCTAPIVGTLLVETTTTGNW